MSDESRSRRFPTRYLVLALLIGIAAVVWFVLERPQKAATEATTYPVDVVTPGVGTIQKTMTLNSYVQSDSVVTVLPKVSGTLIALDADVGTRLKAGEVIARIDPEPYQLALDQAKSAYSGAKSVYDRTQRLYSSGATSQQNYDQARMQYEGTKAQYDLARLQLSYTTITSPVDGTVIRRHVSNGSLVSQSVPVVTISNTHTLVVNTEIPEMSALAFEEGKTDMPIRAHIPAMGDRSYQLRVRNVSPAIDVRTRTFEVQCEILGDTTGILPGMFAEVTFVVDERRNVPYLPYTALVGTDQLWYVDNAGKAQSMLFTPEYHNDTIFEIPSKYADRRFILAGQHFLSAGTPVKVVSQAEAGK